MDFNQFLDNPELLIGTSFYHPNEYHDVGTVYTISEIRPYRYTSRMRVYINWVDPYDGELEDANIPLNDFVDQLNSGFYVLKSIDSFNTEGMFDSLNESEEDFEWAQDVVQGELLPRCDGKQYIIKFVEYFTFQELRELFERLRLLGWTSADDYSNNMLGEISYYTRQYSDCYIFLRRCDRITWGEELKNFEKYNEYTPESENIQIIELKP